MFWSFSSFCSHCHSIIQEILKGEVSLYRWPPVWLVWNQLYDYWQFLFYLKNRLIQTSQTGSQRCSDTPPFSIPCIIYLNRIQHVLPHFVCAPFFRTFFRAFLAGFCAQHFWRASRAHHFGGLLCATFWRSILELFSGLFVRTILTGFFRTILITFVISHWI